MSVESDQWLSYYNSSLQMLVDRWRAKAGTLDPDSDLLDGVSIGLFRAADELQDLIDSTQS